MLKERDVISVNVANDVFVFVNIDHVFRDFNFLVNVLFFHCFWLDLHFKYLSEMLEKEATLTNF